MVNKWSVLRRVLPRSCCLLCTASSGSLLCRYCLQDLPRLGAACDYCALPLPLPGTCPPCQRRRPPYRTRAACRYEYPLTTLIQRLKYHGHSGLGRELAQLMLERPPGLDRPACLLPMPLHWRRQGRRGFNQALEIARPLASNMGLSLRTDLARRIRPTRPQAELRRGLRQRNVSKAFRIQGRPPAHVIIVDDVMTSGHTAAALARDLRRAGASQVTLWVCARAGL